MKHFFLLLLLFLSGCLKASDSFTVGLNAEWYEPPHTVEICDSLTVSEERVLKQMEVWEELDSRYSYQHVVHGTCEAEPASGVIRFDISDESKLTQSNAVAYTSYTMTYKMIDRPEGGVYSYMFIDAATVYIRKLNSNNTILHEIGHAWGWDHAMEDGEYSRYGHLMSKTGCGPCSWEGLGQAP